MDKVMIKNLLVRGTIGVNDWERTIKQDILINITLGFDLSVSGKSDSINDTINYDLLAKSIISFVEQSDFFLVEKLATEIARICCVDFKAENVVVRLEKPHVVRFSDSAGVELYRDKSQF